MKKEFYLGLDIGTSSVGWCLTDKNYKLIRKKGKDLWGVRLFSEANTAADTRGHRSSRRRTQRKKLRLQLLRELFEEEINKVDSRFFKRLDESKFYPEDKKIDGKYSLFNDKNYTDKEYFKDYPTIFHLRKELMTSSEKKDIRLYFLAINQMMKRRGHFLIDGNISNVGDIKPYKQKIQSLLNEEFNVELEEEFYDKIFAILLNNNLGKNDKKIAIKNIVGLYEELSSQKNYMVNLWTLVISGKHNNISTLFDDDRIKELAIEEEIKSIEFTGESFDNDHDKLEKIFAYRFEIINNLKSIYDFIILQDILDGEEYLSYAKIKSYKQHSDDLIKLKCLVRKYDKDNKIYNKIFKDKKTGYVAYIGYCKKGNRKESLSRVKKEDFYKALKKLLKELCPQDDKDYNDILKKIDEDKFLDKQIISKNFIIPYQVHLLELKEILKKLERDYPSFKEISDGVTKTEKIELIFKFRIPYYVGPLNDYHGKYSWIVRNKDYKNENIRPWNFDKLVDLHSCEEEFIKRMINECTYLPNEKVIPKSSLLYSEYLVLNELNNIKISIGKGQPEKLNQETKDYLIENLYKIDRNITSKKIVQHIKIKYCIDDEIKIEGLLDGTRANMESYIDFKEILGDKFDKKAVEDIIEQITIHTGNKKLLKKKIEEKYTFIKEKQINNIISKKYKDWARFSKKLLSEIEGVNKETGQVNTIIDFMRETNDNFMEILSSRYSFSDIILEEKSKYLPSKLDYQVIDNMYISPAVKKMIWQVAKLSEEIKKVLGQEPTKIFIEMARGSTEEEKKKFREKDSRKNQLLKLYKSLGKEGKIWIDKIETKKESEFRNRALFLYYLQMGKCAYSGEDIDLDSISNKDIYDLDHIIPRKLNKDDSILNNLVLVKRHINQHIKKDIYPLPSEIRNNEKVQNLWKYLLKQGFMEKEKYNRLTRKDELSDRELAEFINRQLVETRQSTKIVKDLFENYYKDSKVITVKAGLVSELRHDYNILKCREINDLHHAHDAFLNIIVGDVWNQKFTSNPFNFISKNRDLYTLNNIFTKDQKNIRGEEIWNVKEGKKLIENTLNKSSVIFSNESHIESGELFNATIVGKRDYKENTDYLPIKNDERLADVTKYGGYKSISTSYFFLVEHKLKGKKVKTIEIVPIYLRNKVENNREELLKFCTEGLSLIEPKILREKIKVKSQICVDGFTYLLNGKTGRQYILEPNEQMFWNVNKTNIWKGLYNTYNKSKETNDDLFTEDDRINIIELIEDFKIRLSLPPYNMRINLPKIDQIKFDDTSSVDLFELLSNIVIISKKTNLFADLRLIGGAEKSGKTLIPKNIDKFKEFVLIDQSVTGIFEKRERFI